MPYKDPATIERKPSGLAQSGRVLLKVHADPGYHVVSVQNKGVLGEASKILEECIEFCDAVDQGVKVMELAELADMIGAIKSYLALHHPGITLQDLTDMSQVTERAFKTGRRQ